MVLPLVVTGLLLLMGDGSTGAFVGLLHRFQADDEVIRQMLINVSLGVVVLAIAASIVLSLIFPNPEQAEGKVGDELDSEDEPGVI
jgi:phage shock protein PspC (stress-responsive transcriptional regulator)